MDVKAKEMTTPYQSKGTSGRESPHLAHTLPAYLNLEHINSSFSKYKNGKER